MSGPGGAGVRGPLAQRVVPVPVGASRALIAKLLADLNANIALPNPERQALMHQAQDQQVILMQKMTDTQAIAAKGGAEAADREIRAKMRAATDLRGEALERFESIRAGHDKNVFAPLAARLEKIGAGRNALDTVKAFDDLGVNTREAVRNARDSIEAGRLVDEYTVSADQLARAASADSAGIAIKLAAIEKRLADRRKLDATFAEIDADVNVFEINYRTPDSERRKDLVKLKADYAGDTADLAAGLVAAEALADMIRQANVLMERDSEARLVPLRQELAQLKQRKSELQAEKSTKVLGLVPQQFKGLEATWKQVDAKIASAERCCQEKLPEPGVAFVQGLIADIKALLNTAAAFQPADNDKMTAALAELEKLTKDSKYYLFNTDLKNYLPNDAVVLKAQFDAIDKNTAKMSPQQTMDHVVALREAAKSANDRAQELKNLCGRAAAKVEEGGNIIGELDDIVKKNGGGSKFAGPFKKTVADLKAALALGGAGPDKAAITTLMARFDQQASEFLTGRQIRVGDVMVTHRAGAAQDALDKIEKDKVDAKKKEVTRLLVDTEKTLSAVPVSDQNELAVLKRQLDEINANADKLPPQTAVQRYTDLAVRVQRLKDEPGGAAVSARGQLGSCRQRFTTALDTTTRNLTAISDAIAVGYTGPDQADVSKLVAETLRRIDVPKRQIMDGIQGFFDNNEPQQQPGRLKARETGLTGVRMYRKTLQSDAVLTELAATSAFPNDGLTLLDAALRDVELNLLRSI